MKNVILLNAAIIGKLSKISLRNKNTNRKAFIESLILTKLNS